MAITTSRAGVVIDAIVTMCRASGTFANPVKVFDGPDPGVLTGSQWTQAIFVGFDGNWGGSFEAVQVEQVLAYVGNTSVKETLSVRCQAYAWSGDPGAQQTVRNQALAMLAGVETVLRTNPSLGVDGGTIATLQVGSVYQLPFDDGIVCRIPFTVKITTTILTV